MSVYSPIINTGSERTRKEMREGCTIRNVKRPISSNIMIVPKKDNMIRFCIDYRELIQRIDNDTNVIPRIDDTLYLVVRNKHFSILYFRSTLVTQRLLASSVEGG